ncbi:MAG: hypothetical protein COA96_08305 [SAR86 cluster bacterium]|uniref:Amino acid transport protein n=1 Tax=SAR86 cluster bacterium TaxID=2030880 RepID=A0A2A5B0C9_9GAMM|nr:MAG: hypothetical protein COA96_08305 [SAR86 cluster bacterium]
MYLLTSLIFSSIGLGYFIYGKKQKRRIIYYTGLGLMFYPYLITDIFPMVVAGILLMAAPRILRHLGYD